MNDTYLFTSESVTEGHPDKVCDTIADAILDACLQQDPESRVACEVMCKHDHVMLGGEIACRGNIDYEAITRQTIRDIGYTRPGEPFHADHVTIVNHLSAQSGEIAQGVIREKRIEQGAGDQGIMFGYASNETAERMPLPILLAHKLAQQLATDRKTGTEDWLGPDGKTQVTVRYENGRPTKVMDVVVSTQHDAQTEKRAIEHYVKTSLLPRALDDWYTPDITIHVNPTGSFVFGGPSADCGVTGRKIIVDTYGGFARHGGGAFSGKDPSKVDRSAAYFCRYVARQIVRQGLAERVELQVAYAIGKANPISIHVDTFGTGDTQAAAKYAGTFDFRPYAIIQQLDLKRPIYTQTTNYGHFGKPHLTWEQ